MDVYGLSWSTTYRMADLLREAAQARLVKEARSHPEVALGDTAAPAAADEGTSEAA